MLVCCWSPFIFCVQLNLNDISLSVVSSLRLPLRFSSSSSSKLWPCPFNARCDYCWIISVDLSYAAHHRYRTSTALHHNRWFCRRGFSPKTKSQRPSGSLTQNRTGPLPCPCGTTRPSWYSNMVEQRSHFRVGLRLQFEIWIWIMWCGKGREHLLRKVLEEDYGSERPGKGLRWASTAWRSGVLKRSILSSIQNIELELELIFESNSSPW